MRLERDSMGELEVPVNAYYGGNARRAELNFPISNLRLGRSFIKAIGQIKQSAAVVNLDLDSIDKEIADAIIASAQRVIDGEFDDQFVVDIFQTGSGTSTNMNANEVKRPRQQGSVVQRRLPVDDSPSRSRCDQRQLASSTERT